VSGSHFGKTIAVNPRLVIGRDPECDLVVDEARMAPRHAVLENVGDAIYLRDLAATNATSVNGVGTRNAIVYAGDQLAFERSHFIVEAPGLPLRGEDTTAAAQAITEAHDAVPADGEAAQSRHPQGATWWLIGVAALIALGLVLLIQHGI
jgi:pSer/pThr/pTyr-binding forkhead associated (FHA) protein